MNTRTTEFDRATGVETEHIETEHVKSMSVTAPLMERYDAKSVLVLSYWPGNGSGSGVGGFDWFADNEDGHVSLRDAINRRLHSDLLANPLDHSSWSIMRVWVPANLHWSEYTDYIDDHIDCRETRPQDFSELPLRSEDRPPVA